MKILLKNKPVLISMLLLLPYVLSPASSQGFIDTVEIELYAQFGTVDLNNGESYSDFQLSPDGTHLAVRLGSQIEIWNILDENLITVIPEVFGSAFSWNPDGDLLATSLDETELKIWNPFDGTLNQTFEGVDLYSDGIRSLLWYEEHKIITGSFEYILWDLENNNVSLDIQCHPWGTRIWSSPDHTYFATMGSSSLIWICDSAFEQVISFEGYVTLAWNVDSTQVATRGIHNTLRIWDVATGEAIATGEGEEDPIVSISWNEDDRLVTGHFNGEVRFWGRLSTPDVLWLIGVQSIEGLWRVAWLNDDQIISTGTQGIQIWSLE